MKQFKTPSASLNVPDAWVDMSTYILAGPKSDGFTPTVVVTQSPGILDTYLPRQLEKQLAELRKLPGFVLTKRSEVETRSYGACATLEFYRSDPERGWLLYQFQTYVMTSDTLYTLTATVPFQSYTSRLPELIDIINSFRPGHWSVSHEE